MSPEMGRAAMRLATFCVIVAVALLPFLGRDSAEFVITVASLGMGVTFIALVWLLVRRSAK